MGKPLITVLITTYNYGRFIDEAVESVLVQDYPQDKVQIVVVDDGSTDDTAERVRKYGSRVEYLYQSNGGQASALNLGFEKARGEIVLLLDADDFFLRGKVRRITEAFERDSKIGMVYHRLLEWDTYTDERRECDFTPVSGDVYAIPEQFFFYVPLPTSGVCFRRRFVNRLLPIPGRIRMLADAFLTNLIPFVASILAIPEPLAVYRFHGRNSFHEDEAGLSAEAKQARRAMWELIVADMRRWLADNGCTRKQRAVRYLLDRWTLDQQRQDFLSKPPGRIGFFRHLLLYNQCYRPHLSGRLRTINYFNALGALFTGYERFQLLDEWRLRATDAVRGLQRRKAT